MQAGVVARLVLDAGMTSCVQRQVTVAVTGRRCVTRVSRAGWTGILAV